MCAVRQRLRAGLAACLLTLCPGQLDAQVAPRDDRSGITTLLKQGEYAKALEAIDAARASTPARAERAPGVARLLTLRGLALSGLKRPAEALAAYREALDIDPQSIAALQGAAEIEYRTRRPEARGTIERIVALDPANRVAHGMLGALAFERGDCGAAVTAFERSGAALDHNAAALDQFAHCLYVMGRHLDAAAMFDRLQVLAPREPGPRIKAAVALHAAGRFSDALALVQPLAAVPGADAAVIDLAADLYDSLDRVSEAVGLLRTAMARTPAEESHYVTLGSICLKRQSFDLALEIIEVGLRHLPHSATLHGMRGVVHAQLGDFSRATGDFDAASRLRPDRPLGGVGRSLALQQTGQMEESIVLLRQEAARHPQDAPTLFLLAQALIRGGPEQGSPAAREAETVLRRVVEVAPDFGEAHGELGKLFLKIGEPARAVTHLRRAIALTPTDRTATYWLLLALRQSGLDGETPAVAARLRELMAREHEDEGRRNRFRLLKAEAGR
jgi:tetratricopeptide (TPR) repeat protein